MLELDEFHHQMLQDIRREADANGHYVEDAFFDHFCSELVDAGDLGSFDRASYIAAKGLRVDGYEADPQDNDGLLTLITLDFNQAATLSTLTATTMSSIFKRTFNFLRESQDPHFRDQLDESTPAFGLADLVAKRWPMVTKVQLLLLSNRMLSSRVDGRKAGEFDGKPVSYSVWDLTRLHRFVMSGQGREEIAIDLENDFGGALPALPTHLGDTGFEAYLAVIPGRQLSDIYDQWGARLLEQNVRVFLQARGKINKGIRNTLENDPGMFFAYNNGITATAEEVTTVKSSEGLRITKIANLQIVNGGQTTASIHAASRKKDVDLSNVFVQMKLSIVERSRAVDVVPKISEYANSQNRVNAADFFANHPFHIRMEGFSRRILAPSHEGGFRESKWFYERARGQYQDAKSRLSASQLKAFDLEFPRHQVFSKMDLAKYLNLWLGQPDLVSKGAQKNFVQFAQTIGVSWTKNEDDFNETYFRDAIAKALVFQEVEKLVTLQPWYGGSYRANVVAYAIAKLAYDVERFGGAVDLSRVWKNQAVDDRLKEALVLSATEVHAIIVSPPSGTGNVTEWAKQQACWARVQSIRIQWSEDWFASLISKDEKRVTRIEAAKDQKMLNGIQAQTAVVNAGADFWQGVKIWGNERQLLNELEEGVLGAASGHLTIPSEKQSLIIIKTLRKLQSEGYQLGRDIS